ncbi:MAG: MFS transporter [Clostridia bacterium]|nr:MFS transporter [Clostridia bacterium]
MKNLKQNIKKNYLFVLISRFDLTNGIWMLFLAYKGLNLFEIGLMETVYHISSFSMEIPTGVIADLYGRKTSRVLGRVASVVGTLIMILGQNVFAFGISFFFTALSNNLESGAGDALVYDSMKEIGIETEYMKVCGRNELFYQMTKTVSLLLGGYLATISYLYVYELAFVVGMISIIQALTFQEPTIGKVEKKTKIWDTFISQITDSFKVMFKNVTLMERILSLELFSTFYVTIFFYIQNYLKLEGKSEFEIGIILAVGAGVAAVMATQTYKLEKIFTLNKLIIMVSFVAIVGFWGMTIKSITFIAFVLLAGAEGVMFVTMSDFINKSIPSDKRATILSFQSMIFSFFMIIIFPIVGKLGDLIGLHGAFKMVAILSTLVLSVFIILMNKKEIVPK